MERINSNSSSSDLFKSFTDNIKKVNLKDDRDIVFYDSDELDRANDPKAAARQKRGNIAGFSIQQSHRYGWGSDAKARNAKTWTAFKSMLKDIAQLGDIDEFLRKAGVDSRCNGNHSLRVSDMKKVIDFMSVSISNDIKNDPYTYVQNKLFSSVNSVECFIEKSKQFDKLIIMLSKDECSDEIIRKTYDITRKYKSIISMANYTDKNIKLDKKDVIAALEELKAKYELIARSNLEKLFASLFEHCSIIVSNDGLDAAQNAHLDAESLINTLFKSKLSTDSISKLLNVIINELMLKLKPNNATNVLHLTRDNGVVIDLKASMQGVNIKLDLIGSDSERFEHLFMRFKLDGFKSNSENGISKKTLDTNHNEISEKILDTNDIETDVNRYIEEDIIDDDFNFNIKERGNNFYKDDIEEKDFLEKNFGEEVFLKDDVKNDFLEDDIKNDFFEEDIKQASNEEDVGQTYLNENYNEGTGRSESDASVSDF